MLAVVTKDRMLPIQEADQNNSNSISLYANIAYNYTACSFAPNLRVPRTCAIL